MPTRATTLHSTSTYIPTFVVLRSTCFTQLVWELKLHFYPSSGGFKKKKKKGRCRASRYTCPRPRKSTPVSKCSIWIEGLSSVHTWYTGTIKVRSSDYCCSNIITSDMFTPPRQYVTCCYTIPTVAWGVTKYFRSSVINFLQSVSLPG